MRSAAALIVVQVLRAQLRTVPVDLFRRYAAAAPTRNISQCPGSGIDESGRIIWDEIGRDGMRWYDNQARKARC